MGFAFFRHDNSERMCCILKIMATPKTMSEAEAIRTARGGGNSIGKALYGGKDITLKLMYLESREVILTLHYQSAPLLRWLGVKPNGPETQKIRMIVEGTRCTASYAEDPVRTEEVEADEDAVQNTEFPDDKIIATAKRPALRMVRRQIGKIATAEVDSMRSFYRPYYIAFYGEMKMGERVRYLPIAADGFRVDRAL